MTFESIVSGVKTKCQFDLLSFLAWGNPEVLSWHPTLLQPVLL